MGEHIDIEYQPTFLWVSLDVTRHLREALTGPAHTSALSTYVAMAELHAEGCRGITKSLIADRACISDRKLGAHLARLESLGLLEVVHHKTTTNADAAATYRLLSSPREALPGSSHSSRGDETSPHRRETAFLQAGRTVPPGAPRQDEASDHASPHSSRSDETSDPATSREDEASDPASARPNAVSLLLKRSANADSSTTTQERANAIEQARALWPDLNQQERDVLKQLVELAKARGLEAGWDPATAIGYVRGEFRNRAHVDEAVKFREFYSPGGRGENRSFTNLALRWRNWLKGAPTADTVVELDRRRPGARRPADPAAVKADTQDALRKSEDARRRRRERDDAMAEQDIA